MRLLASLLLAFAAAAAYAQADDYPSRPIRWLSPWPPGGANDIFSRAIAEKLSASVRQPVVVENRPGAAGIIGTEAAARAPADGYVLTLGSSPTHAIAPSLNPKLPYDPLKDFEAVTLVAIVPNVLVVHPGVAATSVRELIALARSQPGKLNFASAGNGTSQHLSAELFKVMTGVDMVHIPYKGTAPALNELLGGQVQLAFDNIPALLPHIQSGRLRALAVTPAARSLALPDLPTLAEAGVPGYDASVWFGVFVPAGTPRPVVQRLHKEISAALQAADLKSRMAGMGAEVSGIGLEEFRAFWQREIPKWAGVVKAAGLKPAN